MLLYSTPSNKSREALWTEQGDFLINHFILILYRDSSRVQVRSFFVHWSV